MNPTAVMIACMHFMLLHVWNTYIQERAEGTFDFTAVMCVMQGMHVLVMSTHYRLN